MQPYEQFANIAVSQEGAVLNLTLNRPELLNALDHETMQEIRACFEQVEQDNSVEIVILRGAGRAFSAGGDLRRHLNEHQNAILMEKIGRNAVDTFGMIEKSKKLYIAIVDGVCAAGGLEMVVCCDFIIVTDKAKFTDGHLNFALLPGAGGTQRIPRMIGTLKAKDIMLTARFFDGEEAYQMGLATYFWPSEETETKIRELVETLLQKSFAARAALKFLVNTSVGSSLAQGLEIEFATVQHFEGTHPDTHEGISAFVEKRAPVFLPPG